MICKAESLSDAATSSSVPACHAPPGAGPASGLTGLRSPDYEPQATRATTRATKRGAKTRRPGSRSGHLGLTESRTGPAKHAGYRSDLSHPGDQERWALSSPPRDVLGRLGTSLREAGDMPGPSRTRGGVT